MLAGNIIINILLTELENLDLGRVYSTTSVKIFGYTKAIQKKVD